MTHIPPTPRPRSVPNPGPRPDPLRLPPNPLEPARRAGATMLLLGAIALLLGTFLTVSPINPSQDFVSTPQLFNAGGILFAGVAFGIVGWIVRGGKRVPVIVAMVIAGLASAYLIGVGVADIRHNRGVGMSLLFLAAIFASLILLLRWLWQAAAIAAQLHAFRQRHCLTPTPPRKA